MKSLLILIVSASSCLGAIVTKIGTSDFQTTKGTVARQTLLFAQMTNQTSLTISCWVKYNWTDAGVNSQLGAGAFQGLVSKGAFPGSGALQFGLFSASEKIGFSFDSPVNTYHTWSTTGNSVQTNSWMHLAASFTYSNGPSFRLFINGTNSIGSFVAGNGNAVGQTNAVSYHNFLYQKAPSSSFFGGAMSELAIWTNALSTNQIYQLAASRVKHMPLQISPATLLFYWPMDTKPHLPTITGENNICRDLTSTHFDLDAGGIFYGERVLSYQPNE